MSPRLKMRELTSAELLYLGAFDTYLRGEPAGRRLMRALLPEILDDAGLLPPAASPTGVRAGEPDDERATSRRTHRRRVPRGHSRR